MANIKCPSCNFDNYFSLAQEVYQGPFRCAGCKGLFSIRIEHDALISCEPLNPTDVGKTDIRKHY